MINTFFLKKWAALLLVGMITTISYAIGALNYGFMYAILFMFGGLLISLLISNLLLKNPFTQLIEGQGILVLDLNSTGVITPFIVKVFSPYIQGKVRGQWVRGIFDRKSVINLAKPQLATKTAKITNDEEKHLKLEITEKEYNDGRFALFHYPVLIWNDQLKTLLTKDFLSHQEKTGFAEHSIIYLNRLVQELSSTLRDFGRYVVETTRPQGSFFERNKIAIIIVIIAILVMGALFAPAIIDAIKGFTSPASGAISHVQNTAAVTRQ